MYQMTDAAFAEARPYCLRHHIVVEDGCLLTGLDSRVPPTRAIELTAVFLDRNVTAILTRPLKAAASTLPGRCFIATSPASQSAAATNSLLQTVKTGLLSTRRAKNFCVPAGDRSTRQRAPRQSCHRIRLDHLELRSTPGMNVEAPSSAIFGTRRRMTRRKPGRAQQLKQLFLLGHREVQTLISPARVGLPNRSHSLGAG
jgi:hypothetical protein